MNKRDRDFAETLVLEVEKHPAIYVPIHPDHKDRYKIDLEWTAIAAHLNSTVEVVKRRWQNLRGSFSKSLGALKRQSSECASTTKPAFYLFDQMKFLQRHMAHASMPGSYDDVDDFLLNSQEMEEEGDLPEPVTKEELERHLVAASSPTPSASPMASTVSGAARRKRRRHEQSHPPWKETAADHFWGKAPKEDSDSDLHFFKGLLPMVSGLKPKNKIKFFAEVTSLLFNHIHQQDGEAEAGGKGTGEEWSVK